MKRAFFILAAAGALLGGPLAPSSAAQAPLRSRSSQATLRSIARADYFPLAVGNWWTYEAAGLGAGDEVTVRVVEQVEIGGLNYFRLQGFGPSPALVRLTSRGRLVERDPASGVEKLWYDFAAPPGGSWTPERALDCLGPARVESRAGRLEAAGSVFAPVLVIRYGPSGCADAGLTEESFAPGVGLLFRSELSIAGPRTLTLREASIGGRTIRGPGLRFSLTLDRSLYTPNLMPPLDPDRAVPLLKARLTIENSSPTPLLLRFASGQMFDLVIRNDLGEEVYRWSADKFFTQAATTLELSPGRRGFSIETPLAGAAGAALPPGFYTVEARLTTSGDTRRFSASVGVEIGPAVF